MCPGRSLPTFRRNALTPTSRSRSKLIDSFGLLFHPEHECRVSPAELELTSAVPNRHTPEINVSHDFSQLVVSQDFRVCLTHKSFSFITEAVGHSVQAVLVTCRMMLEIKVTAQP
jgi:hypothetical protein